MKTPPMIIRLRIKKEGSRGIRLCLPLLLIYIPLFLLALILLPILLVATILLYPWQWSRSLLLIYPRFYALLCALKELEVDIEDKEQRFHISLK